ncbi:hypothetical protein ACIBU0_33280 [Streptomyces sp. NPDC049627]|uniref:hypothetical protein n=1 Tax=Streptomyces sp. NPDC049627 TaxID=3365595 RepID=UPI00379FF9D8
MIQAIGMALPAVVSGPAAALVSAVLFGATFLGVSTIALAVGAPTCGSPDRPRC